MPKLVVVERDYAAVAAKMAALGPLLDTLGATTKGVTFEVGREIDYLRQKNGAVRGGLADGRPSLRRDVQAARRSWPCPAPRTAPGHRRASRRSRADRAAAGDLAAEHEGKQITFADTQSRPVPVITSPEWSGSEDWRPAYSPFTDQRRRSSPGTR
jgi:nitrate reductase alpha subunit